jgi:hypothetical protein
MGPSQWPIEVRDLSANGAMLSGSALPPIGSHVVVALAVAKLRGTIVWNNDDRCGLALSLPIHPLQVVRDMARNDFTNRHVLKDRLPATTHAEEV